MNKISKPAATRSTRPAARRPQRRSVTVSVKAHSMPENWHCASTVACVAILFSMFTEDHIMFILALLLMAFCLSWYTVSRVIWQRAAIRKARAIARRRATRNR
jgi:hypothetical protein